MYMECQENSKLATFNLPVDRSNALRTSVPKVFPVRGRRRRSLLQQQFMPVAAKALTASAPPVTYVTAVPHPAVAVTATRSVPVAAVPLSPLPNLEKLAGGIGGGGGGVAIPGQPQPMMDAATSFAIDEIMRLDANAVGLAEMFLEEDDRNGATLAYIGYGTGVFSISTSAMGWGAGAGMTAGAGVAIAGPAPGGFAPAAPAGAPAFSSTVPRMTTQPTTTTYPPANLMLPPPAQQTQAHP